MGQIMLAQHGNGSLDQRAVMGMYRLRHEVFHDRLGWEVTNDNGMEHDEFDHADPVYVLAKGDEDEVLGCWRLLPTTGPEHAAGYVSRNCCMDSRRPSRPMCGS